MIHTFNWDRLAGWGSLVHFDTAEYKITDEEIPLVSIPKLAASWKVIHEFKPTEYIQGPNHPATTSLSLTTSSGRYFLGVLFQNSNISLELPELVDNVVWFKSDQSPELGVWTRIEISLEKEEDGKYFLSFSVGGKQLVREEVDDDDYDFLLPELDGIKVFIGDNSDVLYQPGFIRGLVVLEKQ